MEICGVPMKIREGFVDSEGHRLAYLAVNEHLAQPGEPAVVFIHGVLASINCWRDAVPPSFRNRAWYALSLPAHHPSTVPTDFGLGQVDADWFHRVMDGALGALLDGRKAIVVGHSTGGFVGLNLAINQSQHLAGVVSVAGFHSGRWGGVEGQLVMLAGLGRWAKPLFEMNIAIARRSPLVQRVFASLLAYNRRAYSRNPLSQRFMHNIRPDTEAQDGTALFYLFNGISKLEIGDRLGEIDVPCHVFVGSHDPVVPNDQSLLIASEIPGAHTVVFRDVGHMLFVECTEAYYRALERAITDINQRTARAARAA